MEMKMKTKNKDSKHGHGRKLKSSATLTFKFCLCVFCLTFVPLGLLRSLGGTASADSASEVGQVGRRLPQGGSNIPKDPNNQYGRKLWRAQISIAKGRDDSQGKNSLMRMIEQVRSVEFKGQKPAPEPVVVPRVTAVPEPNETPSDTTVAEPAEEVKQQIETDLPYKPISKQTLQMLRSLSQNPEKLDNAFDDVSWWNAV